MAFDDAAVRELRDLLRRGQRAAQIMSSEPLLQKIRELVDELERMREAEQLLERLDEAFKLHRDEPGPGGDLLRHVHLWLTAR